MLDDDAVSVNPATSLRNAGAPKLRNGKALSAGEGMLSVNLAMPHPLALLKQSR